MKVQALQTEVSDVDASNEVSVSSVMESYSHCHEMLQVHVNQLQYLIDLHHKVHKVMSASQTCSTIQKYLNSVIILRVDSWALSH